MRMLFFMCLALWVGVEGFLRMQAGRRGALWVMSMGFGSFLVLQYYWCRDIFWPYFLLNAKKQPWLSQLISTLFAFAVLGVLLFILSALRVEGVVGRIFG